jgi:hypothetical protein
VPAKAKKSDTDVDDPRRRQLAIGVPILLVLVVVVPAFLLVARGIPGVFGEFLALVAGIISTPFLLEIFFLIVGIIIVVGLNHLRQRREGDEFVYLEQVDDPNAPADLPEKSSFAIYREKPLEVAPPGPAEAIEGALEIGDHDEAGRMLAELDEAELRQPAILELRLRLARETGHAEMVGRMEALLREAVR